MLKQRVITAVLLLAGFLALLALAPPQLFFAAVSMVFVLGLWEWSDLCSLASPLARVAYVVVLALVSTLLWHYLDYGANADLLLSIASVACLWWALALLWVQSYPASAILWRSKWARALIGAVVLIPAWLTVAWFCLQEHWVTLVLFAVLLVAAADVGAYFSGRAFGKRKLAPAVSPGKTWAGVVGGLLLASLLGVGFAGYLLDLSWPLALALALPAAAVSVVGDLLESMLKRERGIKDSSNLLPGHGGVLDRIDGLVAALPILMLILLNN